MSAPRPLGDATAHVWRLRRMARAAGLDPAAASEAGLLPQEDWAALVTTCRACPDPDGCARWLDRSRGEVVGCAPDLCPQGDRIKALADALEAAQDGSSASG